MRQTMVVLVLAALVLGGSVWWWSRESSATRQASLVEQSGSTMEKFALQEMQGNHTRWKIRADVAQVNPKLDVTTIEGIRLTLFSARHGQVEVTGQRGSIENQSKNMRVCGDVRLAVGQEFSLVTECLRWNAAEQALESDTPVTIQTGNLRAEGRGFRGSLAEERFEILEQVRARWEEP
jgi:LPS export ABC transporter protein LptC